MKQRCHLAQINIARARAPIDDPQMAGFVARLDEINTLAETSPGFVWRMKTDDGSMVQAYPDETIMTNISVWETPEALYQFVYRSMHAQLLRQKKDWFERMAEIHLALWWIAPGATPTLEQAKERLAYLQAYGESEFAFSFARLLGTRKENGEIALSPPPFLQPCTS